MPFIPTLKKIYEFIKIPANAEVCECRESFMKSVDITGARRPLSAGSGRRRVAPHSGGIQTQLYIKTAFIHEILIKAIFCVNSTQCKLLEILAFNIKSIRHVIKLLIFLNNIIIFLNFGREIKK